VAGQQRNLAARFGAKHEIVPRTGHFIQVLRPDVVIDAIENVLERAHSY
jgi:pimeloyl-ACP methyl ester carboxylesterase